MSNTKASRPEATETSAASQAAAPGANLSGIDVPRADSEADETRSTDPPLTRDKERTRKALLESAAFMMFEHGAGVSLAEIAAHAGVSKGALMHHFSNRQQLEEAVLADSAERFKAAVYAHVDFAENEPGKLLRGYVRALTSDRLLMREHFSPTSMIVVLANNPMAAKVLSEDADFWREAFEADGIDTGLSLAVRSAAEGLAASYESPYLNDEELHAAAERLLALTKHQPET